MERGTIVKNNENQYFIFLSYSADEKSAKVMEVQEIFDEYEQIFCTRGTAIKTFPLSELQLADTYPSYLDQITIT